MRIVPFYLTVDVEGEWFGLPAEQGVFSVQAVVDAVHHLEILLNNLEMKLESTIPITWFLRCDDSVENATGTHDGLLIALEDFLNRRLNKGDLFGLHPHLYTHDDGTWSSEQDKHRQTAQIERAASAWECYFGASPTITRIGEALFNNEISTCLERLGVKLDSTALPGRKRFDSGFQFDWEGTPERAYHPSSSDYRLEADKTDSSRNYLEVPFTMVNTLSSVDNKKIKRYLNLAFDPDIIFNGIRDMQKPESVVAVVHPHELLASSKTHHLIKYHPSALEENIRNIMRVFGPISFNTLASLLHEIG